VLDRVANGHPNLPRYLGKACCVACVERTAQVIASRKVSSHSMYWATNVLCCVHICLHYVCVVSSVHGIALDASAFRSAQLSLLPFVQAHKLWCVFVVCRGRMLCMHHSRAAGVLASTLPFSSHTCCNTSRCALCACMCAHGRALHAPTFSHCSRCLHCACASCCLRIFSSRGIRQGLAACSLSLSLSHVSFIVADNARSTQARLVLRDVGSVLDARPIDDSAREQRSRMSAVCA
jgi:hypothetical protein